MLLVTELEDKGFLAGLFNAMYDELPEPKKEEAEEIKCTSF